ncbi:hypothetical protein [Frankia sp. Cr2]|uniref:hypothetical protein n=1 Tax=Frankia sp. Cr2 TaxID=3073932 RepID=UPI002AD3471A|nr:hypothetical protein [Frankia sp. Cr2]
MSFASHFPRLDAEAAMWFLLIPPIAVLVTLVWLALRSRPERRPEALITVEGYRRSMAALARPMDVARGPSVRPSALPTPVLPTPATTGPPDPVS